VPSKYAGGKLTCKACGERFVVKRFKKLPLFPLKSPITAKKWLVVVLSFVGVFLLIVIAFNPKHLAAVGMITLLILVPLLLLLVASAFLRWFLGIQDIIDLLKVIAENTKKAKP